MKAIQVVRELRPDLWTMFTEHEKNDEGYGDISEELDQLFREHLGVTTILEEVDLAFEVRKQVRREAGLWY